MSLLHSVATFSAMSLVGIYPGKASLKLLSQCYYLWFKAVGLRLSSIFFLVFDLRLGFPCYCLWFKAVGFRFSSIFFLVLDLRLVFHVTAFSLRPSALDFHRFVSLFDLRLLFPYYCLWCKAIGFGL